MISVRARDIKLAIKEVEMTEVHLAEQLIVIVVTHKIIDTTLPDAIENRKEVSCCHVSPVGGAVFMNSRTIVGPI